MSYLDINIILCEEERVPCKFLHDSVKLGHLDPFAEERDISADARVELPMWLGEELAKKFMVEINAPKHFGSKMRDEMRAGASNINFRDFSFYFFDIGLLLSRIAKDDDLRRALRNAFTGERYRNLAVRSLTPGAMDDLSEYTQSLTFAEVLLFKEGLRSLQNLQNWRTSESSVLKRAPVLGRRDNRTLGNNQDSTHVSKRSR